MSNKRNLLIEEFNVTTDSSIYKFTRVESTRYIRVGRERFIFPSRLEEGLNDIHNMTIRPDDVFVATFPRSGTTWTQELVWLIVNNCDFETAKSTPLSERYSFIEFPIFNNVEDIKSLYNTAQNEKFPQRLLSELGAFTKERLSSETSQRFLKTHLPFSILPPDLLGTAKVVYIARDPRDVCVSFYHLSVLMVKLYRFTGNFKNFWDMFKTDLVIYTPYFAHVKLAWEKRNHPNMLFLFYEEMIQDMPSVIHRVSKFFGKTYDKGQIHALCEHLNFKSFSKNKAVLPVASEAVGFLQEGEQFVRKGKTGGWREYFDEEMIKEAERWMEENLRDTDLRFPQVSTAALKPKPGRS